MRYKNNNKNYLNLSFFFFLLLLLQNIFFYAIASTLAISFNLFSLSLLGIYRKKSKRNANQFDSAYYPPGF